jgi:hypothetical protein
MPVLSSSADILSRRLPKVFSSRAHRAADYAMVASFALGGAWFWRQNRMAAAASWISGGSLLALTILTTYPGRSQRLLDADLHAKVELAVAALVATMPELLEIREHQVRHYFRTQAAILTLISNLTSFTPPRRKVRT